MNDYTSKCMLWTCIYAPFSFLMSNIFPYRTQQTQTQGRYVQAQVGMLHSTRSISKLGLLLSTLLLWTLLCAKLGHVITPLSHPRTLPQAMTGCQLLLRMWWEEEMQEILQHNQLVSWVSSCCISTFIIKCLYSVTVDFDESCIKL